MTPYTVLILPWEFGSVIGCLSGASTKAHPPVSRLSEEKRTVLISIGHQHFVENNLIVEILKPESARALRIRRKAAGRWKLINATEGKRIRSVINLKSGHVVLSAVSPETLESRQTKTAGPALGDRRGPVHSGLQRDINDLKPHDPIERRVEPDRRRFSYTAYIPERRSGAERRSGHSHRRRRD